MSVQRQFIKTVSALFFGMIGSGVLQFGVALYVLRTTGSSLSFAVTMIIAPIVQVGLTPLVGHVVDRVDHKRIIGLVQLASVLTLVVFAFLFNKVDNILYLVLPVLTVLRIADMFFSSAYTASLRNIVSDDKINRLQSFLSGFQSIAGILSPILGAALYALLAMPIYILLVALCELLALLINLTIDFQFNPSEEIDDEPAEDGVMASFIQGWSYIRTRPDLIRLALNAMLVNFFLMSKSVGQPLLIINYFGLSDAQYGIIQMASSVGLLALSLIYGVLQFEPKKPLSLLYWIGILMGAMVGLSAVPALTGFSQTMAFYYFLIMSFLVGGIAAMVNIPMMTYMQKQVPDHYKGRVFTLFGSVSVGLTPISILLFGWLYERFPVSPIFLVVSVILMGSITLLWLNTPKKYLMEDSSELLRQS